MGFNTNNPEAAPQILNHFAMLLRLYYCCQRYGDYQLRLNQKLSMQPQANEEVPALARLLPSGDGVTAPASSGDVLIRTDSRSVPYILFINPLHPLPPYKKKHKLHFSDGCLEPLWDISDSICSRTFRSVISNTSESRKLSTCRSNCLRVISFVTPSFTVAVIFMYFI